MEATRRSTSPRYEGAARDEAEQRSRGAPSGRTPGRPRRRIEGLQEWLYVIIVSALALYLVIGVIAWTWMLLTGIPAPGAFTTILAAIAGALAGVLSPLRAPSSVAGADSTERTRDHGKSR